jgi:hypothetical protein
MLLVVWVLLLLLIDPILVIFYKSCVVNVFIFCCFSNVPQIFAEDFQLGN